MASIITVENLSKRYIINHQRQGSNGALRDLISQRAKRLFGRTVPPENGAEHEEFWALKDVSFHVEQGDRVGIIGRNGAGKSTLLKILSRITEPTSGKVSIRGRVSSLLEVGTGFHPELTGRENIFLNGAILGMSKIEIKNKFDEIVAFAEVEKFLDTPVKRYSSGMYVRLAFAVAAHLEPEILIVDEALAVGDAQFQKKCLGKMEDAGREGRTILFVSHNMGAVQQLTSKAMLLVNGHLEQLGHTQEVVAAYLDTSQASNEAINPSSFTHTFQVRRVRFNQETIEPGFNRPLHFDLEFKLVHAMKAVNINLGIFNSIGARLLTARCIVDELPEGDTKMVITVPDHRLPPGDYSLLLAVSANQQMLFRHENLLHFSLSDLGMDEPLLVPFLANHRDQIGAFVRSKWSLSS